MTNETTASQPTPHQNTLDAITGAIAYGRQGTNPPPSPDHWLAEYWAIGQQLAELGKTSAWDNVTPTASQPKSIGDDAMREVIQDAVADNMTSLYLCGRHQSAWGAGTMGLDDFSPAGDSDNVITNITDAVMSAIHKEIEFRAPAAQASATIQAAPEGFVLVPIKPTPAMLQSAGYRASAAGNSSTGYEMYARLLAAAPAATIQEPVMVAEPVGDGLPPEVQKLFDQLRPEIDYWCAHRRESNLAALDAIEFRFKVSQARTVRLESTALAAPMVADPAGVAITSSNYRDKISALVHKRVLGKIDIGQLTEGIANIVDDALALAATVKAVPSEAPAKRNEQAKFEEWSVKWKYNLRPANEGSADTYMEGETETAWMGWMACVDSFAAPLADKTGGGE